jgi:Fe-Mn family superoxide dismutase
VPNIKNCNIKNIVTTNIATKLGNNIGDNKSQNIESFKQKDSNFNLSDRSEDNSIANSPLNRRQFLQKSASSFAGAFALAVATFSVGGFSVGGFSVGGFSVGGFSLGSGAFAGSLSGKKSISGFDGEKPPETTSLTNKNNNMTITLPPLPYEKNALAPHISENTLNFHYGKHHQGYVNNLNNLIKDSEFANLNLEEIIKKSANDNSKVAIFNNSAQIWNHTFYWNSMKPNGGGKPEGKLLELINQSFGSFEEMLNQFKVAATTQFGSGWAWLVLEGEKLKIVKTANAETPLTNHNQKPLLTIDVWEHAYYLDFQNARPNYIDVFFNNLVNWQFASENL